MFYEDDSTRTPPRETAFNGSQYPEIHAQIEALQRKQTSWSGAIMLLGVSLLIFIGLGSARWDWKFALLIVPILLFHELGHYIAMRAFKYRNLRMFFIPLLGAAVSGSNYNVPGWKKVIVSLMGPVPGILAAIPLGLAGFYLHQDWLMNLALLTVVLNGFNLLPILPLDGGWIMHTLFFSRHYTLDFAFRLLAVLGLGAIALALGDTLLVVIAIFMALGLPASLKLARISTRLRREQLPQMSADNQTIPPLTAERIIGEVKAAFPKVLTPKLAAQHVLHIFETLNARPPGWFGTLFYTGVHVASLVVAIVVLGVLVVGQQSGFTGMIADSYATGPAMAIECGSIQELPVRDGGTTASFESRQTIVATFGNREKSGAAFEEVQPLLGEGAPGARLFGQTLLVALGADAGEVKARILELVESEATNVFVQGSNFNAFFSIDCIAPDEEAAELIGQEAAGYFDGARLGILPAWIPGIPVSSNRWAEMRNARRTFDQLNGVYLTVYSNDEVRQFEEQIAEARRRGDDGTVEELRAEQAGVSDRIRAEEIAKIAAERGADAEVVRLFGQYPSPEDLDLSEADEAKRLELDEKIAALLGKIERRDGKPVGAQMRYAATWGEVSQEGRRISLRMVQFRNIYFGGPALVEWLCAQGCTGFRYDFGGTIENNPEFEE